MEKFIPKARKEFQVHYETHGSDCALVGYIMEDGELRVATNTACHASLYNGQTICNTGRGTWMDHSSSFDDYDEDDYEYDEEDEEEFV